MAVLIVKEGPNVGDDYALKAGITVMGRRSTCDIQIHEPKSSRQHCEIIVEGSSIKLRDLGSTNGTKLNGAKITEPVELKPGDTIAIGKVVYELLDETAGTLPEIPGYKIEAIIGSGGTGTVYKALHIPMDRTVAIKVLHEKYNKNPRIIERFIREARAVGKLNHPNIIQVHDVSKSGGVHYFSMEYVEGRSLRQLIKNTDKTSPKKALDLILQMARALEYSHSHNIIHRDIKPDNALITKQNVVKLLDLGIAKIGLGDEQGESKISGTPHYMSPEQVQGKPLDGRTDIYSLGAVFYEMLTGEKPFTGETTKDILKAHLVDELPAIQEINDTVPDAMVFVIERMMAKNPDKRYKDMRALIEDLEKLGDDDKAASATIKRVAPGDSVISQAVRVGKAAAIARRRRRRDADTGKQAMVIVGRLITFLAILLFLLVGYIVLKSMGALTPEPVDEPPTASRPVGSNASPDSNPQTSNAQTADNKTPAQDTNTKANAAAAETGGDATQPETVTPAPDADAMSEADIALWRKELESTITNAETKQTNNIDERIRLVNELIGMLPAGLPGDIAADANAYIEKQKKHGDELFQTAASQSKTLGKNNIVSGINVLKDYLSDVSDKRYADRALGMISKLEGSALKEHDKALRRAKSYLRFFKFKKAKDKLLISIHRLDGSMDENGKPQNQDIVQLYDQIGQLEDLHKLMKDAVKKATKPLLIPFKIEVPNSPTTQWRVHSMGADDDGEYVNIVPYDQKNAPGEKLYMAAFSAEELYQLYMLYLKDSLNADLHNKFAILCKIRKLPEKQKYHEQQRDRLIKP